MKLGIRVNKIQFATLMRKLEEEGGWEWLEGEPPTEYDPFSNFDTNVKEVFIYLDKYFDVHYGPVDNPYAHSIFNTFDEMENKNLREEVQVL